MKRFFTRLMVGLVASLAFGAAYAQTTCTATSTTPCFGSTKNAGESPLSTTLIWSVPGAATCAAGGAGGVAAWSGSVPTSGTRNLSGIAVDMNLTLACVGPVQPGNAVLSWTHDGKHTDGTTAALGGFTVLYGTSATALTSTVVINDAAVRTYTVEILTAGQWFFSVKARNTTGAESANSNVAGKVVTTTPGAVLPVLSVAIDVTAVPTAPVLTVADGTAMEIRENSSGALVASRIGLVPVGTRCYTDERTVSSVKYNGVPIGMVDFINWPYTLNGFKEAWAKCEG